MESRKRAFADDGELSLAKKRVMTKSPDVNGTNTEVQEEPTDVGSLELFRKEAIFRRMKHYSRENERSQTRIAQLEQRKTTCEAGLLAIAACWEQLVDAIRTLAPPDQLSTVELQTDDLFDLSQHVSGDSGLKAALEQNMHATQRLVTSFMKLGEKSTTTALHDAAYQRSQKSQTECTALRSEVALIRSQLRELEAEKQKYREDLSAAESRLDRLQSSTVIAMQARAPTTKTESSEDTKTDQPQSSPAPPINGHDHTPEDLEQLRSEIKAKQERVSDLERENALLSDEILSLKIELRAPSPERIAETAHYKLLLDHASRLESAANDANAPLEKLKEELDSLRSSRKEFEEETRAAANQATQELKTMLAKRDSDNSRLRDVREQQAAEIQERRQRDSHKTASLHEFKTLAESRSERISVLESEVRRHKARIAAQAGDEDLMRYFFKDQTDDIGYIHDLKKQLRVAESKSAALVQSLASLQIEHPDVEKHIQAEANVRQQLADTLKELEQYRSVFGPPSSLPPDERCLAEQLRQKDDELRKSQMVATQLTQTEATIYAELDKLSSSWEALDRQVKSKVFDLGTIEERLTKVNHDKAKSDNKFFAAMREKEAIDTERKNILRNLEKQAKVVERLVESEKGLNAQVTVLEKETTVYRKALDDANKKIVALDKDISNWKHRADSENHRFHDVRGFAMEKAQALKKKETETQRLDEELHHLRKELERQTSQLKRANSAPSSQKEAELQKEISRLWEVVKCTACKQGMRSVVLTKCMHTFCKSCIDARLSTRQRRCPNCNLGFAASEAQTVYFQ
ncbi:BRE1 E3 ubiquitin ligase-domain-containing protein [Hygrophoropsis aurantiaca]|uniref:BRE1 E3 ubiquitin ligase-domain-containing protein n=1 Tax=Hygrophoropsis aurantiaca TaxID=72124 RepID=A0ACB8AGG8_9AGAM|nr:BRE1 E3 ubiquitin ligase-domain-containing protein [Hygrophoropsis aurantiaca]